MLFVLFNFLLFIFYFSFPQGPSSRIPDGIRFVGMTGVFLRGAPLRCASRKIIIIRKRLQFIMHYPEAARRAARFYNTSTSFRGAQPTKWGVRTRKLAEIKNE